MIQAWQRAVMTRVFHLLYHRFAWAYDAVSAVVSGGQWQAWGAAARPFLSGPCVLELGHGPGHLLATLADEERTVIGLDLSPQMSRLAARRLARRGLPARLTRGRAQALPFAAGAFDSIVAAFPTPYIVEPATAVGVWRALRPGGRLIIVPYAESGDSGLSGRVIGRLSGRRSAATRDDEFWHTVLAPVGFRVAAHRVAVGNSIVTVVVAERSMGGEIRD